VWRLSEVPESGFSLGAYPNPFYFSEHDFITIDRLPDDPHVYVYTLSGELVRVLQPAWPIEHTITWDGKNENSERVARGVYIILAMGANETRCGKVAVLK
jgi:flagellar hook assembly protein FlgD